MIFVDLFRSINRACIEDIEEMDVGNTEQAELNRSGAENDNEQTELNGNEQSELNGSRTKNNDEQSDLNDSDTEFIFPNTLSNDERSIIRHMNSIYSSEDDEDDYDGDDDDDDGGNDDNDVIIISSDVEGENDNVHPLLNYMLNFIPESPEHISNSLQEYSNNLVRSVLTSASSSTQTSATTTTTTTTAAERLERCCICLTDITRGGINLHHNDHRIHVRCLINLLANSQIIWTERLFRFRCPLCRSPVLGSLRLLT